MFKSIEEVLSYAESLGTIVVHNPFTAYGKTGYRVVVEQFTEELREAVIDLIAKEQVAIFNKTYPNYSGSAEEYVGRVTLSVPYDSTELDACFVVEQVRTIDQSSQTAREYERGITANAQLVAKKFTYEVSYVALEIKTKKGLLEAAKGYARDPETLNQVNNLLSN
jgi:hypothetical protein